GHVLPSVGLVAEKADHALAELRATHDSLRTDWDHLAKSVGLISVGLDVRANRVEVGLKELTPQRAAVLTGTYGSAVRVVEAEVPQPGACVSRFNCGSPVKGGLGISSSSGGCTSGYIGRHI